eukprot:5907971-Amphidinium_carterae.1
MELTRYALSTSAHLAFRKIPVLLLYAQVFTEGSPLHKSVSSLSTEDPIQSSLLLHMPLASLMQYGMKSYPLFLVFALGCYCGAPMTKHVEHGLKPWSMYLHGS